MAVREMGLTKKVMPEDCQSEAEFCVKHGLSAKSATTLRNYAEIKGFWEEVEKEKRKYKHLLLSTGMVGLIKRAEGMVVVEQALSKQENVFDLNKELPPDVKACERLVQLGGGDISDKVITESSAAAAFRAAAAAESEVKK
jgi:hypothetical protein